jgi:hypothetical protein
MVLAHGIGVNSDHLWCIAAGFFQPTECASTCKHFILSIHYEILEMKTKCGRKAFTAANHRVFARAGQT